MKGTENLKNKAIGMVEKIARREVEKNASGWPECAGIFHQPKRPSQQNKK